RPIAHGLLVFSVGSGLGVNMPMMRTLAVLTIREWHFRGPVFIGDTIRVRSEVIEKETRARGRRGVITWKRQLIVQDEKAAQEAITLTLVEGRAALARSEEGEPPTTDSAESPNSSEGKGAP